jgi:hypothetical protein
MFVTRCVSSALAVRVRFIEARLARARLVRLALTGGGLLLVGLLSAPAALAGTPTTVTVRVLGPAPAYEALTPPTQVTTTSALVTKEGGECSGTSAGGALELATKGDWQGTWSASFKDYEVIGIDGRGFPFEEGSPANFYWSFWRNYVYAEMGICEAELTPGDQVLFVPSCYGPSCPPEPTRLLAIEAPATVEPGQPVSVTVRSYPALGGESSPAAAIAVTGALAGAQTDGAGHATVTFSADGTYVLRAAGPSGEDPQAIPGEASVCVHTGNDGACGTQASASSARSSAAAGTTAAPYKGPFALVPELTSVLDSHVYGSTHAPRLLTGAVSSHSTVTSVSLRLRREYRRRCYAYDGVSTRFVGTHCGKGAFFKVSGDSQFSYLLPSALPPGRYVLDIEATDAAGNRTTLARGTSRIVFYVAR